MSAVTAFAAPVATRYDSGQSQSLPQKRKRTDTRSGQDESSTRKDVSSGSLLSAEYSAVISPAARSQKRLAGLAINQALPEFPFPHAAPSSSMIDGKMGSRSKHPEDIDHSDLSRAKLSLHAQHLAAVFAILHRSMMVRDYTRAHRALSLILRNNIAGRPVDIRGDGLWEIGAEILLYSSRDGTESSISGRMSRGQLSRDGFERAKLYYEALMIQYPVHKTWPDAINSVDFNVAMFQLWIYVVHQGSTKLQAYIDDDVSESEAQSATSSRESKIWEAEQARRIAAALSDRMKEVIYRDHPELIRLRQMVTAWLGDLLDSHAQSVDNYE